MADRDLLITNFTTPVAAHAMRGRRWLAAEQLDIHPAVILPARAGANIFASPANDGLAYLSAFANRSTGGPSGNCRAPIEPSWPGGR